MHLLLLSAGTQVSAAFTPELICPLGAAPCCMDPSVQVSSLCLPAIPRQQTPRSGRASERGSFPLCALFLPLLDAGLCYCTPQVHMCYIFVCVCLLTSCIKTFIRKATSMGRCAQQNTQCLCLAALLVFFLQVQLWESGARDHAGDFVPEDKEASSKCQQGHL